MGRAQARHLVLFSGNESDKNEQREDGERHPRHRNVSELEDASDRARTGGVARNQGARGKHLQKVLVERYQRARYRKHKHIVRDVGKGDTFQERDTRDECDGVHENALPPAQVARRKKDDILNKERPDEAARREHERDEERIAADEIQRGFSPRAVHETGEDEDKRRGHRDRAEGHERNVYVLLHTTLRAYCWAVDEARAESITALNAAALCGFGIWRRFTKNVGVWSTFAAFAVAMSVWIFCFTTVELRSALNFATSRPSD